MNYLGNYYKPEHELSVFFLHHESEKVAENDILCILKSACDKFSLQREIFNVTFCLYSQRPPQGEFPNSTLKAKHDQALLNAALDEIEATKPNKVVFTCRGIVRLKDTMNDVASFRKAAQWVGAIQA